MEISLHRIDHIESKKGKTWYTVQNCEIIHEISLQALKYQVIRWETAWALARAQEGSVSIPVCLRR